MSQTTTKRRSDEAACGPVERTVRRVVYEALVHGMLIRQPGERAMKTYEVTMIVEMMQTFKVRAASPEEAVDIAEARALQQQESLRAYRRGLDFGDTEKYIGPNEVGGMRQKSK